MVVGDGSVVVVDSNTWTTLLLEVVSLYVDEYIIHKSVHVCIRYMCMCK